MKNILFTGASTALITPFSDGRIDTDSFGRIIDLQLGAKIPALTVCGTTGESATLSDKEKLELISFAVSRAVGKAKIIAGTGSNDTAHAVKLSRKAESLGCDALLAVTPYYNKASPEGLYRHYSEIAAASSLPVILYNVPSRTGLDAPVGIIKRLFEAGAVAAVKEASGNISKTAELISLCPGITVYSGNDDAILPTLSLGGKGVISVLSNLLPGEVQSLCTDFFEGRTESAAASQAKLYPLISALFSTTNPIPVKYLMSRLGLCRAEYRLPMTAPTAGEKELLDRVFEDYFS